MDAEVKVAVTCAACGKVFYVAPAIAKLLMRGIPTCSGDCAMKVLDLEEDR
jgi:hypothetical protein